MQATVKLIRKETIADNTMAFYFTKPKGFDFRAGQFAGYTLINPREQTTKAMFTVFACACTFGLPL
jgi:ferredoxin-NADP reductase